MSTRHILLVVTFCLATAPTVVRGENFAAAVKAAEDAVSQAKKTLDEAQKKFSEAKKTADKAEDDYEAKAKALKAEQGRSRRAQQFSADAEARLRRAEASLRTAEDAVVGSGMAPGLEVKRDSAKTAHKDAKGKASAASTAFDADSTDANKKILDEAKEAEARAEKTLNDAEAALGKGQEAKTKAAEEAEQAKKDLAIARDAAGTAVTAAAEATKAFAISEAAFKAAEEDVKDAKAEAEKAAKELEAAKMAAVLPLEVGRLGDLVAQLQKDSATQSDLEAFRKEVREELTAIKRRVTALEGWRTEVQGKLKSLADRKVSDPVEAEKLARTLSDLLKVVDKLASDVTELKTAQGQDAGRLKTVEDQMKRLNSILDQCVKKTDLRGIYGFRLVEARNGCGRYTVRQDAALVK